MKPLIAGNWKLNPQTEKEASALFDAVKAGVKNQKAAEVVICPPSLYLPLFKGLALGAQNCYFEEKGAFTGEISAQMIKSIGAEYVIIGHSERRKYFKETDEEVNKKVRKAIAAGLDVVLCIGETAEERDQQKKTQVIKMQLDKDLDKLTKDDMRHINLAYEPIWAIGTGNNCSVEETTTSLLFIKQTINNMYNREIADKTRILYGGSVNGDNAGAYIKEAGANGLLVGGASLKSEEFIKIVKSAE